MEHKQEARKVPNTPLELISKGFYYGDPMGATDATPLSLFLTDDRGREYIVKFKVRNVFLQLVDKAVKRLIPLKRPVK